MPNLPTYERKVGPERFAPSAPKQNFGDVIGEGVARLGEGLYQLGGAIAKHKQSLETSQADRELSHAINMVREHLNNFDLQLNEDDEFMLYEDKYKQLSERIATEIPETITTKEGKDRFALWWEEQSEINRFKIAKRAQDANLAWQAQSLQDDVNAIVSRADDYALDDLKSMLDGAKKNGLLTNDKYLKILDIGKRAIYEKQVQGIAISMGLTEGRDWLLKGEFSEELDKYVPIEKRVELADKLYAQWTKENAVANEHKRQQQEQENDQAFQDFIGNNLMTPDEIDKAYPTLDPSQKLYWKSLHDKTREAQQKVWQAMGESQGSVLSYVETEMRAAKGRGAKRRLEMLRDYVFEHENTPTDLNKGLSRDDFTQLVDDIDRRLEKIADDGEEPDGEIFRVGMREIEQGLMNETRMRELGSQLPSTGEASEKALRALWRQFKSDAESRRKAAAKKDSDLTAINEINDMLMDHKTDYHDIENRILELRSEERITGPDGIRLRDYARKEKAPPELLTAKLGIDGIINEIAKNQSGEKKLETYADAGRIKNILTQEYYEDRLPPEKIMEKTKELMRPYTGDIWNLWHLFRPQPEASQKQEKKLTEKDLGESIFEEQGIKGYRKNGILYRVHPDGRIERREGNRWVTDSP